MRASLFLFLLMELGMQQMHAMFNARTALNIEQAATRAEEWADRFAKKIAPEKLHERLPRVLVKQVASFFATQAWRNKFYEYGATYRIHLGSNITHVSACGHELLVALEHECDSPEQRIYDINRGSLTKTIQASADVASLSLHHIVLCDDEFCINVYDREKSSCSELIDLTGEEAGYRAPKIKISPDEQYIALGTAYSTILVFQHQNAEWKLLYRHKQSAQTTRCRIEDLQFNKSGTLLISLCEDNSIYVWDVKTGKVQQIFKVPETINIDGKQLYGLVNNCIITNDDQIVAASREHWRRPLFWDVATGQHLKIELQHKLCGQDDSCFAVTTDLVTKHITSHHTDGKQKIWDATTGDLLDQLPANSSLYKIIYGRLQGPCTSSSEYGHYIISHHYKTIWVSMSLDSVHALLQKLSLTELMFLDDLMKARAKIQKNQDSPIVLSQEQLILFKQFPLFVQTALRINLNLTLS